jgi:hypothetical protein
MFPASFFNYAIPTSEKPISGPRKLRDPDGQKPDLPIISQRRQWCWGLLIEAHQVLRRVYVHVVV